jgi:formylmethanofuran dehydrogenase subunit B
LADQPLPADADLGIDHSTLKALADEMKSCNYGALFFGLGLAQLPTGHANVTALISMIAELNQHTRFVTRRLRIPGDVAGADSVLCWQTGYPFAVNFSRGYPRYNPGEYSADALLSRGETDACLLVGSEASSLLSKAAQQRLAEIPTIALDYPHVKRTHTANVHFTTAVYGIHAAGTAYRMDEIPIPLRALVESEYATDAMLLEQISERL